MSAAVCRPPASSSLGRTCASRLAVTVAGIFLLTACQVPLNGFNTTPTGTATVEPTTGPSAGQTKSAADAEAEKAMFTEFTDIPIPEKSDLDLDKMLVLGGDDGWIGRLSLKSGFAMTDMYSFYEREMPKFGWEKLSTVRSAISTMTYGRGDRIAIITVQPRTTGGSRVDFTVSPSTKGQFQARRPVGS